MKSVEDDGVRRLERGDKYAGGVEAALVGGAKHGGEDLLTLGAARSAVAAAAGLARDDRRTERVLGAPVGDAVLQ